MSSATNVSALAFLLDREAGNNDQGETSEEGSMLAALSVLPQSSSSTVPPNVPSPTIRMGWGSGCPRVRVRLPDGTFAELLFDTGAYRSFLTKRGFQRLRLAGGKVEGDGSLSVPGITVNGFGLQPIRFGHESDVYKDSVDGFADGYLGMDVLSRFKLGLNLSKNEFRLYPSAMDPGAAVRDWFGEDGTGSVFPTKLEDEAHRYCVWVDVGNLTVPMQLDTGCDVTLLNARCLPFLTGAEKAHPLSRGTFRGDKTFSQFRVDWVGPRDLPEGGPRRIAIWDDDRLMGGILGRDATTPLRILLDFPGGTAYFADAKGRHSGVRPVYDGPTAMIDHRFFVHWRRDALAHVPAGATYGVPEGYLEIEHADGSHDLIALGLPLPKINDGQRNFHRRGSWMASVGSGSPTEDGQRSRKAKDRKEVTASER